MSPCTGKGVLIVKKFLDIVMPMKTAACYIFTGTVCVYTVLDMIFGWGGLPDHYLISFLLLSLAGGVLLIVAFTGLVIKKLRYTLRLCVFSVPYLAVLSAIAVGFDWMPAAQPGAWVLFSLIFLAVLLGMTLGFEVYFRVSGKKYDGLLGQYRASRAQAGQNRESR